jgi:hypothetical protein
MNARISLPIIPAPKQGEAAVFVAGEGFKGPFFNGPGDIDLHCGGCATVLAKGMSAGQIKNLVFKCPICGKHNVVVDIPVVENFVSQLIASDFPAKAIPKFKKILKEGLEHHDPAGYVTQQLVNTTPELSWFEKYLVPSNAGETYALLGCILAFVTWYQTRPKKKPEEPKVIVNNYFFGTDPFKDIGRNDPCPCGSGSKFKHCHGKSS